MSKLKTNSVQVQKLIESDERFEDALIAQCDKYGLPLEVRGYWENIETYYHLHRDRIGEDITLSEFKKRYKEEPRFVEYKEGQAFLEIGEANTPYVMFR